MKKLCKKRREKRKSRGGLATDIEFVKWYDEIAKCVYKMPYDEALELYYAAADEWPDNLPLKPDEWDGLGERKQTEYLRYVRDLIETRAGKKALSRYRHKKEEGMTDQQFDDWWESDQQRRLTEELVEKLEKRYCNRQQSDNVGYNRVALALSLTGLCLALAALALRLALTFFFN